MPPDPATPPLVRTGFLFEPLDDGCLLYEPTSGKMVTLNHAAEAVLSLCTGEFTPLQIEALAAQEFALSPAETALALQQLRDAEVI